MHDRIFDQGDTLPAPLVAGSDPLLAAAAPQLFAFPLARDEPHGWIAQLVHAMRGTGSRTMVIDAGNGSLARASRLRPEHELLDLLDGTVAFEAVAQATADRLYLLRSERGVEAFVAAGLPSKWMVSSFAQLSRRFDAVVLAMPVEELAHLAPAADTTPVIAMEEGEEGTTRAYGTIEQMAADFGYDRFALVVRGAKDRAAAQRAHRRLAMVARTFLHAEVAMAGWLPPPYRNPGAELAELAATLLDAEPAPLSVH